MAANNPSLRDGYFSLFLAFGIGWVLFNLSSFLIAMGLFLVVYLFFWICFYIYFKLQVKKLNDELEQL